MIIPLSILSSLCYAGAASAMHLNSASLLPRNSNFSLTPELGNYEVHQALPNATWTSPKDTSMQPLLGTFTAEYTELPTTLSAFDPQTQVGSSVQLDGLEINITMLVPSMNNIGGTFRLIYTNTSNSAQSPQEQAGHIYCVYKTPVVKTHKLQDKTGDGTVLATVTNVITTSSCNLISAISNVGLDGEFSDFLVPLRAPVTLKHKTTTTKNGPVFVEDTLLFFTLNSPGPMVDFSGPGLSRKLYGNAMLSRTSLLPGTTKP